MARLAKERCKGEKSSRLKAHIAIGILSEILLVAGVLLIIFDVYTNQEFIGCGWLVTTCGYYFQLIWPVFYLAIALLVASAIGFLLLLNQSRKSPVPLSETA